MSGTGSTVADGALQISGTSVKSLNGRTLVNNGSSTGTWTGTGSIQSRDGAILQNPVGKTFEVQNDALFQYVTGDQPTIQNAGTFRKSMGLGTTSIGALFNNSGTVEILTGTLEFTDFSISNYTQSAGSTILNGGILEANRGIQIGGGSLTGSGMINADVNSGGNLVPGLSPGSFEIDGNLTLTASSELRFELGGLTAGTEHDFIEVATSSAFTNGQAQLDGDLVLTFTSGFEMVVSGSDILTLLTSEAPITGSFDNAPSGGRLCTADSLGSFLVHYGSGSSFNPNDIVLSDFRNTCVVVPANGGLGLWCLLAAAGAVFTLKRRRE
jgi:hypothetical protein